MYLLFLLLVVPWAIADDISEFHGVLWKMADVYDAAVGGAASPIVANLSAEDVNTFMNNIPNVKLFRSAISVLHTSVLQQRADLEQTNNEREGNNINFVSINFKSSIHSDGRRRHSRPSFSNGFFYFPFLCQFVSRVSKLLHKNSLQWYVTNSLILILVQLKLHYM